MSSAEEIRARIEEEVSRRFSEHLRGMQEEFETLRQESERRWEAFLGRFEQQPRGLVPAHLIPEPQAPAAPAAGSSEIRDLARTIESAANQVETLKSFLTACTNKADRVILLVAKGDGFVVWKAEGFSSSDEARLRALQVSPSSQPALAAVVDGGPLQLASGNGVSRALGAGDAQMAALIPIVVHEKVSALLYADSLTGRTPFDAEGLALLAFLVGVAIDRLVTRKITPAPALRPMEPWREHGAPAVPELEEMEPAATRAIPIMVPPPVEPPPPPPPAREPAPPPAAAPAAPPRKVDLEGTGKPYQPPAGVTGGAAARILRGPLAGGEEDPHDQAKRIARLLVSDIKLYNEAAITEGKKHNDIYARLKEDIDRAQQTYNERVPASIRQVTNYFQEELVRSIADGRPEALGA